jgi:hypothetical protein
MTWRSIADQLTAEQVQTLERDEMSDDAALFVARDFAAQNLAAMMLDAPPADAVDCWCDGTARYFTATERIVHGVTLRVEGRQDPGGTCTRWIRVDDAELTPDQARELATALAELAESCR